MRNYLRDSTEFQYVYSKGKRYDGKLITVFVIHNESAYHRLGVTASKRAIGKAVERNRAKRLMREAFRFSKPLLNDLAGRYDWVLNAKSTLLTVKVNAPAEEFAGIIGKVGRSEKHDALVETRVDKAIVE
ncbi:MAG TPA: ribonuclease P protein component [Pyrinomonadaceae bacterium]|nr:ribonuclease P protein component [Pyrinomonadaceae bacterium]